ncbi:hypothetical protein AAFF_G00182680 [Aldrovandia affinis]|uniref:Integrase catalytic domain-containing protein n=1 Tax=Aldrovandia affinis TaxID=143900 RepID=A0AAD7RKG9_9TELE|nr:hypothetical protein AAFF_G00182680 [Aldrovandia affinis]
MENLKDMLVRQYNQDFPEKENEEKREMSCEDRRFMDLATSSAVLKNRHYHLPLPFRDKDVVMPNNHEMAVQRTVNLARRFKKDSAYAAEYKAFMDNVLAKGYAERVPQEQLHRNDGHVWHIPHHGVYHKRKNKLRVVFDCSSSYRGRSLNAELLQGPDLASSLLGVLLRFRQERIAIMADIEVMYYQVQVHEDHRDFLRFLWWPGGDTTKPLEAYRMNVHLFGAVSSPSVANFALKQTAYDNTDKYSMEVLDTIKHGFYVDHCLKSVTSARQAVNLIKDLRDACSQGGFTLTKWVSNSQEVLRTVPENHRAALVQQLDLDREKTPLERVLGIQWNIQRDQWRHVSSKENPARRMQARVGEQKMADLPEDRIAPDLPPFSHVGIDYFGPIEIKRGRAHVKRWGVIFTCLVSRAVHLEVASTLNTDSCINVIRRFLCRREPVLTIRTDCGTNFVAAQKELQAAMTQLDHQRIQDALLTHRVKWLFNPPSGAHFGGVWERLIGLVKKLKTKLLLPPGLFCKDDLYMRKRWRQVQYLADLFWRRLNATAGRGVEVGT